MQKQKFFDEIFEENTVSKQYPVFECPECGKTIGPYDWGGKEYLKSRAKQHFEKAHKD